MTTTLPALLPDAFPGFPETVETAPRHLPPLDADLQRQVAGLLTSPGFDAWSEALARVGNCASPIRLHGGSQTVDPATGEILSTYSPPRPGSTRTCTTTSSTVSRRRSTGSGRGH